MAIETILFIIVIAVGFYMAWSVGANDVANAMGTSVGSGALTVKRAVIVAAVLEFSGAFLVGSHVSETIRKGIISPEIFAGNELDLVFGMIGALLAAAIWLQVASYFGWPVSTTHSIVGAVLGFGVLYGGINAADWNKVASIASSWVISPLLSGTIAFMIFSIIRRYIFYSETPVKVTKKLTPYIVFIVFHVLTLAMVFKGLKNLNMDLDFLEAFYVSTLVGFAASIVSIYLIRKIEYEEENENNEDQNQIVHVRTEKALKHLHKAMNKSNGLINQELKDIIIDLETVSKNLEKSAAKNLESDGYKVVERIFVYLQILSAAFVAFAHGANDVANAVGPMAAVVSILKSGEFVAQAAVPLWILGLGGMGIVFGLATWGWRVMITIGKKITELTPSRGFSAEFATAVTIVIASKMGLPVSTTHTLVGGVLGVGFARGIKALNLRVITNIVVSWLITIPVGAVGAIAFYYLFKTIFSA